MKKQYEEMNMSNLGRPYYFDPELYLDAVEHMIVADELIFALKMLENMPAWYRANPLERAVKLRKDLMAKVWTVFDYSRDPDEREDLDPLEIGRDLRYYPRISILRYMVKDLSDMGYYVNINEFCPGNFSVLKHLDFGYVFENVNQLTSKKQDLLLKHPVNTSGKHFNIFLCFEVIEHLWDTELTLEHWASKVTAHGVMVSTPYGCMGGGMDDWRNRDIGHVRRFTQPELMGLVGKIWPGKHWYGVLSTMQVAIGSDIPLNLRYDKLSPS